VHVKISVQDSSYTPIRQSQGSCMFKCWTLWRLLDGRSHTRHNFRLVTVRGRPGNFFFSGEPVALKFDTQTWIVFLTGTGSCRPSSNRMRNARWVVIREPPLRINSSTTNSQCSPRHAIATTANGTYTAINWYLLRGRIPATHTAPCMFILPCKRSRLENYLYMLSCLSQWPLGLTQ
jgi:hypothetical protein